MDGMSNHDHKHDAFNPGFANANLDAHDNHPPTKEERELREYSMDIAAANSKALSATGKQYWRSIEELAGDPHFEDLLHREFPRAASEWDESVDRRDFLKLMGASMALAGMAGCGRTPEQTIVPYVKSPDGLILGKPQQ